MRLEPFAPFSRAAVVALAALGVLSTCLGADKDIRFNSLGYLPPMRKQATVAAECSAFRVRRVSDDSVAYSGTAQGPLFNQDTSEQLWIVDFSSLDQPGDYYLEVTEVGKTAPFPIGHNVYEAAYRSAMRGFYLWRCGMAVEASFGSNRYRKGACHLGDAYQDYTTGAHDRKDGTQGWHDAGDYGKYVVNAGVTMGLLFKAWEHFQGRLEKVPLGLPETAAGYPEFLQELKWEMDWLLKMQLDDGRVSHKLTRKMFSPFVMPEQDRAERFFVDWGSAATADFAAMASMAARIFRRYDPDYAERCLSAAWRSYQFLSKNPQDRQPDQSDFSTGGYRTSDPDDRLWATAELWETTGDRVALDDFEARASSISPKIDVDFDWGRVKNLGMLTYLQSRRPGRNQKLAAEIRADLLAAADAIAATASRHGYGRPLGSRYYWGCNGSVARQALILQSAYRLSGSKLHLNAALDALGYLFGRNLQGRSYVTGVGIDPPLHPHDRRSGADGIEAPWPGYLVGGGWPRPADWQDVQMNYRVNEIAVNWQAALVYALAGFLSE